MSIPLLKLEPNKPFVYCNGGEPYFSKRALNTHIAWELAFSGNYGATYLGKKFFMYGKTHTSDSFYTCTKLIQLFILLPAKTQKSNLSEKKHKTLWAMIKHE